MSVTAMVIEEFAKPLVARQFSLPEPGEGEALVKITAAGVCGSDVHIWNGEDIRTKVPMIPGHEGVGELVASGGRLLDINGREVRPGDRMTWERGVPCGSCYACVVMRDPALCLNRRTYGIHIPLSEPPHLNGCYATHIMLRKGAKLIGLQDYDIDPAVLVPACCSGATTAHAFDINRPKLGDAAVIQGPGPLGIFAVDMAKRCGAANIVVIGRESPPAPTSAGNWVPRTSSTGRRSPARIVSRKSANSQTAAARTGSTNAPGRTRPCPRR